MAEKEGARPTLPTGCEAHAETIANLNYALYVGGGVIALLFQRLSAARDKYEELQAKVIEETREDAVTDKETAEALERNAIAMEAFAAAQGAKVTTMGPTPSGGNSAGAGGVTLEPPRS